MVQGCKVCRFRRFVDDLMRESEYSAYEPFDFEKHIRRYKEGVRQVARSYNRYVLDNLELLATFHMIPGSSTEGFKFHYKTYFVTASSVYRHIKEHTNLQFDENEFKTANIDSRSRQWEKKYKDLLEFASEYLAIEFFHEFYGGLPDHFKKGTILKYKVSLDVHVGRDYKAFLEREIKRHEKFAEERKGKERKKLEEKLKREREKA